MIERLLNYWPMRLLLVGIILLTAIVNTFGQKPLAKTSSMSTVANVVDSVVDSVVVQKAKRDLQVFKNGNVILQYRVSLGQSPIGHKQQQGDSKTPEGTYKLYYKNPKSSYYKSFLLDYPNRKDKLRAKQHGVNPGNAIALHGTGRRTEIAEAHAQGVDWTDGCIAVSNAEIDTLWKYIPVGTLIKIYP